MPHLDLDVNFIVQYIIKIFLVTGKDSANTVLGIRLLGDS